MDADKAFNEMNRARDAAQAAEEKFLEVRKRDALQSPPESGEVFTTRGGHVAICMGMPDNSDTYVFIVIRRGVHSSDLYHVRMTFSSNWTGLCDDTNIDVPYNFDIIALHGKLPI